MSEKINKKENKKAEEVRFALDPPEWRRVDITVGGESMLMHKMLFETVMYYDDFKKGKNVTKKKDNKPLAEKAEEYIHYNEKNEVAFPATGFRKGMSKVMSRDFPAAPKGSTTALFNKSIWFLEKMVPIKFERKRIHGIEEQIWGSTSGISKNKIPVVRPQFINWEAVLKISYISQLIDVDRVVWSVQWAGACEGIGDDRLRKEHGIYHITDVKEYVRKNK